MTRTLTWPHYSVKKKRTQYEDWILNLVWFSSGLRYAVITAHNKVIVADALTGNVISSHNSTLNCILYPLQVLSYCVCYILIISILQLQTLA